MIEPFDLVVCVLAVYRIAYLIAREDGPFDLAANVRAWVGQQTWIGRGFHCPMCLSFWGSLVAAWMLAGHGRLAAPDLFPLLWGAIAGGCAMLHWWRERA